MVDLDAKMDTGPGAHTATRGRPALPCLYSLISNENEKKLVDMLTAEEGVEFTNSRKRTAFILAESVEKLTKLHPIEKLGFLTLTFKDHVTDPKEAQRRLNSLLTRVIKPRYGRYIGVFERQKNGRIHYHFLVTLPHDIRTGVDFNAIKKRDYKTAGKYLRDEWFFWRTTAKKYCFGRTELLPIRSTAQAIKYYVGKYISKSVTADKDRRDKGVRLPRYSKGVKAGNIRFAFISNGATKWRKAVAFFAELLSDHYQQPITELDHITERLGNRWAYKYRNYILCISEALEIFEGISPSIEKDWLATLKKDFDIGFAIKIVNNT